MICLGKLNSSQLPTRTCLDYSYHRTLGLSCLLLAVWWDQAQRWKKCHFLQAQRLKNMPSSLKYYGVLFCLHLGQDPAVERISNQTKLQRHFFRYNYAETQSWNSCFHFKCRHRNHITLHITNSHDLINLVQKLPSSSVICKTLTKFIYCAKA